MKPQYRYVVPSKINIATVDSKEAFTYVPGKKLTRYDTTHKHPELEKAGYKPITIKHQGLYTRSQLNALAHPPSKAKKAVKDLYNAKWDAVVKAYGLNPKTKKDTLIDKIIDAQGIDLDSM